MNSYGTTASWFTRKPTFKEQSNSSLATSWTERASSRQTKIWIEAPTKRWLCLSTTAYRRKIVYKNAAFVVVAARWYLAMTARLRTTLNVWGTRNNALGASGNATFAKLSSMEFRRCFHEWHPMRNLFATCWQIDGVWAGKWKLGNYSIYCRITTALRAFLNRFRSQQLSSRWCAANARQTMIGDRAR